MIGFAIVAALTTTTVQAPAPDWWWVAGDSKDGAAVFVDAQSVRRLDQRAAIDMVRVDRNGARLTDTWRGRCDAVPSNEELKAVAAFACGSDETRMNTAAMLGGLTPQEAARAIFAIGSGFARSEAKTGLPL